PPERGEHDAAVDGVAHVAIDAALHEPGAVARARIGRERGPERTQAGAGARAAREHEQHAHEIRRAIGGRRRARRGREGAPREQPQRLRHPPPPAARPEISRVRHAPDYCDRRNGRPYWRAMTSPADATLADRIDALLPQTQ